MDDKIITLDKLETVGTKAVKQTQVFVLTPEILKGLCIDKKIFKGGSEQEQVYNDRIPKNETVSNVDVQCNRIEHKSPKISLRNTIKKYTRTVNKKNGNNKDVLHQNLEFSRTKSDELAQNVDETKKSQIIRQEFKQSDLTSVDSKLLQINSCNDSKKQIIESESSENIEVIEEIVEEIIEIHEEYEKSSEETDFHDQELNNISVNENVCLRDRNGTLVSKIDDDTSEHASKKSSKEVEDNVKSGNSNLSTDNTEPVHNIVSNEIENTEKQNSHSSPTKVCNLNVLSECSTKYQLEESWVSNTVNNHQEDDILFSDPTVSRDDEYPSDVNDSDLCQNNIEPIEDEKIKAKTVNDGLIISNNSVENVENVLFNNSTVLKNHVYSLNVNNSDACQKYFKPAEVKKIASNSKNSSLKNSVIVSVESSGVEIANSGPFINSEENVKNVIRIVKDMEKVENETFNVFTCDKSSTNIVDDNIKSDKKCSKEEIFSDQMKTQRTSNSIDETSSVPELNLIDREEETRNLQSDTRNNSITESNEDTKKTNRRLLNEDSSTKSLPHRRKENSKIKLSNESENLDQTQNKLSEDSAHDGIQDRNKESINTSLITGDGNENCLKIGAMETEKDNSSNSIQQEIILPNILMKVNFNCDETPGDSSSTTLPVENFESLEKPTEIIDNLIEDNKLSIGIKQRKRRRKSAKLEETQLGINDETSIVPENKTNGDENPAIEENQVGLPIPVIDQTSTDIATDNAGDNTRTLLIRRSSRHSRRSTASEVDTTSDSKTKDGETKDPETATTVKKRGRKRRVLKHTEENTEETKTIAENMKREEAKEIEIAELDTTPTVKKRGRPRKLEITEENNEVEKKTTVGEVNSEIAEEGKIADDDHPKEPDTKPIAKKRGRRPRVIEHREETIEQKKTTADEVTDGAENKIIDMKELDTPPTTKKRGRKPRNLESTEENIQEETKTNVENMESGTAEESEIADGENTQIPITAPTVKRRGRKSRVVEHTEENPEEETTIEKAEDMPSRIAEENEIGDGNETKELDTAPIAKKRGRKSRVLEQTAENIEDETMIAKTEDMPSKIAEENGIEDDNETKEPDTAPIAKKRGRKSRVVEHTEENPEEETMIEKAEDMPSRIAEENEIGDGNETKEPDTAPIAKKRGRKSRVLEQTEENIEEKKKTRARNMTREAQEDSDTAESLESIPLSKRRSSRAKNMSLRDETDDEEETTHETPVRRGRKRKCPFNMNEKRKKGRPRKGQERSPDDNYTPHHSHLSPKKTKGKIVEKKVTVTAPNMVTCGKCQLEMPKPRWQHHNLTRHNDLGWLEGTEKPDFDTDDKLMKRVLANAIKKRKGILTCELCNSSKRSVPGFVSHVLFCGKNEEEMQALMITCPVCQAVCKPSSMEYHEKIHREKPIEEKKAKILIEETEEPSPRVKRKAAERAVSKISEFTDLVRDDGDTRDQQDKTYRLEKKFRLTASSIKKVIKKPQTSKKIPNSILVNWRKIFEKSGIVGCRQPGCKFIAKTFDEIKEHFSVCNFTPQEDYVCKICKFKSKNLDEITKHALETHAKGADDDYDESESSDSDYSSGDDDRGPRQQGLLKTFYFRDNAEPANKLFKFMFKDGACHAHFNKIFHYAFDWTLEFEEKNYSDKLFEEHAPKTFIPLDPDQLSDYLPELEESMTVKSEKSDSLAWKKWKRFEGKCVGDVPTFFTGGPVWAMAWLPVPTCLRASSVSQYLAVSTHTKMDEEYSTVAAHSGKNIIQIWKFAGLDHKINSKPDPELAYAIAHEGGTVWSMDWCPSGCYQEEERMGLLAAGCSDGQVRVYSLAFPDSLPESSEKIYKTDPCLVLTVNERVQETWQITTLCWSKQNGHKILVAGFSNGYVAFWNLTSKSPMIRSRRGNSLVLNSCRHFFTHHHTVTMAILVYQGNRQYLATASLDRLYKFWDLEDVTKPRNSFKKSFVTGGSWMNHWCCAFISHDDALSMGHNYVYSLPFRQYTYNYFNLLPSNSVNYSVSTSDFGSSVATGTVGGEVQVMFPHQLIYLRDMERSLPKKRYCSIVSTLEVVDFEAKQVSEKTNKKSDDYKLMPSTYEGSKDRFGLSFLNKGYREETISHKGRKKTLTCDMMKSLPVEQYPFTSVNRVSWNPNATSFLWLATGYQNGFVRLISFKSLANTTEWNKSLSLHAAKLKERGT